MANTVPPKHPSQRARRNKSGAQVQKVGGESKKRKVPALGPQMGQVRWDKAAREYWKLIWESPVADLFLEVDKPALRRLTFLAMLANQGALSAQALAEMRQMEDRYGMSPRARRMLLIEVDPGDEAPKAEPSHPADDERYLRLVDNG